MTDTVYDKLDRIEGKVDALSPSAHSEPQTLDEQLATKDPRVFEFIENADRVFCYMGGDKSALKRHNLRNKKRAVITAVISFFSLALLSISSFFVFNSIVGVVTIIIGLVLCTSYVISAAMQKTYEYKIPYKKWFSKLKTYDFDDNDIVCGTARTVWYIKMLHIISVVYLYIGGFAIMLFGMDSIGIYAMLDFFVIFAGALTLTLLKNNREWYSYKLIFESGKVSIPYDLLKEFMTENNLK